MRVNPLNSCIGHYSELAGCAQQPDYALRIFDGAAERMLRGGSEWQPPQFEDFAGLRPSIGGRQFLSEKEMYNLGKHAWRADYRTEAVPSCGLESGLFGQLPPGGHQGFLVGFQPACRNFTQPSPHHMPVLIEQTNPIVAVERDDSRTAGVLDDVELKG